MMPSSASCINPGTSLPTFGLTTSCSQLSCTPARTHQHQLSQHHRPWSPDRRNTVQSKELKTPFKSTQRGQWQTGGRFLSLPGIPLSPACPLHNRCLQQSVFLKGQLRFNPDNGSSNRSCFPNTACANSFHEFWWILARKAHFQAAHVFKLLPING